MVALATLALQSAKKLFQKGFVVQNGLTLSGANVAHKALVLILSESTFAKI